MVLIRKYAISQPGFSSLQTTTSVEGGLRAQSQNAGHGYIRFSKRRGRDACFELIGRHSAGIGIVVGLVVRDMVTTVSEERPCAYEYPDIR